MSEKNESIEQLRTSVNELNAIAEGMVLDDRYASDKEYCAAAESLYAQAVSLNKLLEERNTRLLANSVLPLSELNQGLRESIDKLNGVVRGINTTAEVVSTVAKVVVFLGPIGL